MEQELYSITVDNLQTRKLNNTLAALCEAAYLSNLNRDKVVKLVNLVTKSEVNYFQNLINIRMDSVCRILYEFYPDIFSHIEQFYPELTSVRNGNMNCANLTFNNNDLLKAFVRYKKILSKEILATCHKVGFSVTNTMVEGWTKSEENKRFRHLSSAELLLIISNL